MIVVTPSVGDSWYVVSAATARIVGRVSLPSAWQLLGGDDTRIIVLQKDELDIESVAVYDVHRD